MSRLGGRVKFLSLGWGVCKSGGEVCEFPSACKLDLAECKVGGGTPIIAPITMHVHKRLEGRAFSPTATLGITTAWTKRMQSSVLFSEVVGFDFDVCHYPIQLM